MEDLMRHVKKIAGEIGARPPASKKEAGAAAYVSEQLKSFGFEPKERTFKALRSGAWLICFLLALGVAGWTVASPYPVLGFLLSLAAATVFLLEFLGFSAASGFWPAGESRSVSAEMPRTGRKEPKIRVVVMANLDSGKGNGNSQAAALPSPSFLVGIAALFLAALAFFGLAQATNFFGLGAKQPYPGMFTAIGASLLIFWLAAGEVFNRTSAGASDNASGLAVLLGVAETLAKKPLKYTQIEVLAVGAKNSGHWGIRHFMAENKFHKDDIIFINVDRVGSGEIFLTTTEGFFRKKPCFKLLAQMSGDFNLPSTGKPAVQAPLQGSATTATFPISRNLKAVSIMAGGARAGNKGDDLDGVQQTTLNDACALALDLLEKIDNRWK